MVLAGCGGSESQSKRLGTGASAGSWKTWVLSSPAQVSVPAPPAPGSPEAQRDMPQLRAVSQDRGAAARARAQSAEPVVQPWLSRAMTLVSQREKNPPRASRAYAVVSVAMHDAAAAAAYWRQRYKRTTPGVKSGPSYPSLEAAVAGAGSRAVGYTFAEASRGGLDAAAEDVAGDQVAAGRSSTLDAQRGLALGRAVAERVIANVETDGSNRRWDGKRPPHKPGIWEPPPGSIARPTEPLAGTWRPWLMSSGAQFRPPPPPAFGSRQSLDEARELIRIKNALTPKQKHIAQFWAGGQGTPLPPGIWNQVMFGYLRDKGLSVPSQTRVFALLNVAMNDAGISSWDAKYAYWNTRPENGIRELGLDRRWKPFLETPFFPAYVSGHATYSAAAGEVLAHLFPQDAELWRAKGQEAGYSRLLGGIHWRSDNTFGGRMGLKIGALAVQRAKRDGAEK